MKKSKLFIFVLVVVQAAVSGCQSKSNKNNSENTDKQSIIVSKNIRFCESTYPYEGGILIGNFGT